MSQARPSHLQTPTAGRRNGRRQTMGPVPIHNNSHKPPVSSNSTMNSNLPPPSGGISNRTNRRQSIAVIDNHNTSKASAPRPSSRGRKSMIPRVGGGRENTVPNSPSGRSVTSTASTTTSHTNHHPQHHNRRPSMGGASTTTSNRARRQSFVPAPHSNNALRDPRPLTDKAFQQECAKAVLHYLTTHGYEYPVSLKTLKAPSTKDFGHMVTFLLQRIDPLFHQTGMSHLKFEDEVVLHFRALGYPFAISKTSLVAAGSPHAWPALLAALAWLVQHLTLVQDQLPPAVLPDVEDVMAAPVYADTVDELLEQSNAAFYDFLLYSYKAFIDGLPDEEDRVKNIVHQRVARDQLYYEEMAERLNHINENIALQMEELQEQVQRYVYQLFVFVLIVFALFVFGVRNMCFVGL